MVITVTIKHHPATLSGDYQTTTGDGGRLF